MGAAEVSCRVDGPTCAASWRASADQKGVDEGENEGLNVGSDVGFDDGGSEDGWRVGATDGTGVGEGEVEGCVVGGDEGTDLYSEECEGSLDAGQRGEAQLTITPFLLYLLEDDGGTGLRRHLRDGHCIRRDEGGRGRE